MLIKLLPNQISKHWDEIKVGVRESMIPMGEDSDEHLMFILESLLAGEMTCWAIVGGENGKAGILGIGVTTIQVEPMSRAVNLLIYSLYGWEKIPPDVWQDALNTIRKYANGMLCDKIIAYTDTPEVVNLVRQLGGKAEHTLITLEV